MIFALFADATYADWLKDRTAFVTKNARPVPRISRPFPSNVDFVSGNKKADKEVRQFLEKELDRSKLVIKIPADTTHLADENFDRVAALLRVDGKEVQMEFVLSDVYPAKIRLHDPILSLSLPLASAIRHTHQELDGQAKPIPEKLQNLLARILPKIVLQHARYTTGELQIRLPELMTNPPGLYGDNGASTVGDIIVFPKVPNLDNPDDLRIWIRQLHHVYQYQEWGIDLFAYRYAKHKSRVE